MNIGVKALATTPRKTIKRNQGVMDISVYFVNISFQPGHYLYADEDEIVVAGTDLI